MLHQTTLYVSQMLVGSDTANPTVIDTTAAMTKGNM